MKKAFIVAGLAFGDEGKGKMVDFLVRHHNAGLVVRYNGGPQAAHNVVTPEGVHHTFSQFGSGTLAGARTHLSRYMLVEPMAMEREAQVLQEKGIADPFSMLTVDPNCIIITPWHKLLNRLKETLRGDGKHGSVGLGVGEARADQLAKHTLHVSTLSSVITTAYVLEAFKKRALAEALALMCAYHDSIQLVGGDRLRDAMKTVDPNAVACKLKVIFDKIKLRTALPDSDTVVFEGAQGLMLDETHGFAPYNSWTDCTFNNADQLLLESGINWNVERIGVLRTYYTRHGNGPFPTEDLNMNFPELHNGSHPWMGKFRQGKFDRKLAQFAASKVGMLDCIALTHCDRMALDMHSLRAALDVPIKYLSDGPTALATHVRT